MKTSKNFTAYLKQKELSKRTVESYEAVILRFLAWLKRQNIKPEHVRYADMLVYMKHCQQQGAIQSTIQNYLNPIRHFYNYLVDEQQVKVNPVLNINVQGVKRKTLYHILEAHELHAIYNQYTNPKLNGRKNKVMIGLLVYQGLKTEELDKLETKDVKLKEGSIEIPGGRKSNGRTLQLEPHQILDIYDYMNQVRPELLKKSGQQTEKLFVSKEGGDKLRVQYLTDQLKAQHPKVESLKQIRASVIVKWLKQYNLREVQYLAGHRYISSTEAYQKNEMEGLTEEVNQFHPLG